MAASPPKRLLVVDDEVDLLFMMGLAAEKTGRFVVEKALDGEEGLAKALRFRPDVAVLDAVMPKMDGFELCRCLRANPLTKRLPIVILSGGEPVRCEVQATAAGADRFVRKPYDQDALMSLLISLCRIEKRISARRPERKKKGQSAAAKRRPAGLSLDEGR